MNNNTIPAVEDMFAREDAETTPYDVEVLGETYTIIPGVFSPKVRRNSSWYAEKVPLFLRGSSFLEIGAGAGVLAVRAAQQGYKVVATDIDPRAVENTQLNAQRHHVEVDARLGSVYEPLQAEERFDTIFWNHPWIFTDEVVEGRHALSYDWRYTSLRKFLAEGQNHLTPSGQILLGTGSLARTDLIEQWAREDGYEVTLVCQENHPLAVGGSTMVDFLIYRLVPKR